MSELAAPDATAWMESVELRSCIHRLPLEEREVLLLHYLEGYTSSEIASVLDVPARTVRLRLAQAREHLRQELGEDDLTYLNEPLAPMRQWAWLPLDQMHALETRPTWGSHRTRLWRGHSGHRRRKSACSRRTRTWAGLPSRSAAPPTTTTG
jgi:predicted DNA-binding protein (UPF0251 family)